MDATENSFAKKFLYIFQGRQDAYGGDTGRAIYETVTPDLVQAHLDGSHEPIGIYPIRFLEGYDQGFVEVNDNVRMSQMRVRWGCADIDTGDWNEAYRLATALQGMGLTPWVERSRSKGWHVWIFVPQSVAAYEMRRCLKVAYAAIGLPAKEANPKSELLRPNQLGNYVRLPYPEGLRDDYVPNRQAMMVAWEATHDGTAIPLDDFLAHDAYSDPDKVRHWASKWYEPPKPKIVVDAATTEEVSQLVNSLPRPAHRLWEQGPAPGPFGVVDTSQGLVGLAYGLAIKGWKASDVYLIVKSADERWGKFHERNDPESYYTDIVERAFR